VAVTRNQVRNFTDNVDQQMHLLAADQAVSDAWRGFRPDRSEPVDFARDAGRDFARGLERRPGAGAVATAAARRRAQRKRPPRLAVADAPGVDLRPDPRGVTTAAELIEAMRNFRIWAGDLSLRTMAEQSGQLVSAATLHRALAGPGRPSLAAVQAVIIGCGGSDADVQRFSTAWRRVRNPALARSAEARPVPDRGGRAVPIRAVPGPAASAS